MAAPGRRPPCLAATAATAAHCPLTDLPRELLARVLSRCDPADIARAAAVSLLFHSPLAVEGIRLWGRERGFELPAQPEGEGCAVRWLCYSALLCESNPPARAATGERHSLFIDGEGRLSSCGCAKRPSGLLGHGEGVTQLNTPTRLPSTLGGERAVGVSAGVFHSLALTASGAVWSWGYGGLAGLGHGDWQAQLLPKKVEAFADQRVVAVSAGDYHSLALTADGAIWSWGYGAFGRLGHGDDQNQLLPKKVEAFAGQRVVAVSAGAVHSLAITANGSVWSWGEGGMLGHAGQHSHLLLPKKIEAFAGQRVVAVTAASWLSLALTTDGAVWVWGRDVFQKGLGWPLLPEKGKATAGKRVVAVSAGGEYCLAITADGAVFTWGCGRYGKLGHGDEQQQRQPKKIEAFAGRRVVDVSAGGDYSLAITADGSVFTWGKGKDGCLGHGEDTSNQLLPKKIEARNASAE